MFSVFQVLLVICESVPPVVSGDKKVQKKKNTESNAAHTHIHGHTKNHMHAAEGVYLQQIM